MSIWIITTGSSDVQLNTDKNWGILHQKIRNQLETQKGFSQTKSKDGQRSLYPARAMGVVYGNAIEQHYDDLAFPLLDNFWGLLTERSITPQRIIVIVTDQTQFFKDKGSEKNKIFSPYWQDTCTLQPLLRHYLAKKSDVDPEFLTLELKSSGLDNWNDVLEIVQQQLKTLGDIPQDETVYVSHQAGTPAISSAVQFASLAKFGDRVKFLVSSEQDKAHTDILESSAYLQGIEIQQVNKLLDWHDYAGAKEVLKRQIKEVDEQKDNPKRTDNQRKRDEKLKYIEDLLDAAIQWNFAEFVKFKDKLKEYPQFTEAVEDRTKKENWWWTAYEAAYLSWIRLKQGNTVDAFFHSFRSVEGAFSNWGKAIFHEYIKIENDRAFLQPSILRSHKDYFKGAKFESDGYPKNSLAKLKSKLLCLEEKLKKIEDKNKKPKGILLAGEDLYILFRSEKPELVSSDLNRFWNSEDGIAEKRNKNFHQLQGVSQHNLFRDWEVENSDDWEKRILNYLNCISEQAFELFEPTQPEAKPASLMSQVHAELVKSIANL